MPTSPFILYLDFDGVLHDEDVRWLPQRGIFVKTPGRVLFEWMPLLEEIVTPYPDLRIVLSTSWVHVRSYDLARGRLSPALQERVIGATFHRRAMDKERFAALPRGVQVMRDVARRGEIRWIAIDDADEGWPSHVRDRLVFTNPQVGLSEPRAQTELARLLAHWNDQ